MGSYYDDFDYQSYWIGRKYEDGVEKLAIKKFLKRIPQKDSLIDIGAGFGRLAEVYVSSFNRCLLVDPSKELLGQAELSLRNLRGLKRLRSLKSLTFRVGNAERLPVESESFNVALVVRVIHHLEKPEQAFREIYRVLKPGGFLILEFANKIHFRARIRAWLKGDFSFSRNLFPQEQRTSESIKAGKIVFLNHHPETIRNELKKTGFVIMEILSVSNFRLPLIKTLLPPPALLFLENFCQKPLAKIYFGPSIFVLAQKLKVSS